MSPADYNVAYEDGRNRMIDVFRGLLRHIRDSESFEFPTPQDSAKKHDDALKEMRRIVGLR